MTLDGLTIDALSHVNAWSDGPLGWERGALSLDRVWAKRAEREAVARARGSKPRRVFASDEERRAAKKERDRRSHLATKKGRKRAH